jgi:hypothetical protein
MELKQVFTTPDGQIFDTRAEAMAHLRKPKILAALTQVSDGDQALSNWLFDNQDAVVAAFDCGVIRRVSKSDAKRLRDAVLHAAEVLKADKKAAFLVENHAAIIDSFRWPTVKRLKEDEKAMAVRNTLTALAEDSELADWIISKRDAILEAYEAGVEKRVVSPKAAEALAAYLAKKREAKAAAAEAEEELFENPDEAPVEEDEPVEEEPIEEEEPVEEEPVEVAPPPVKAKGKKK